MKSPPDQTDEYVRVTKSKKGLDADNLLTDRRARRKSQKVRYNEGHDSAGEDAGSISDDRDEDFKEEQAPDGGAGDEASDGDEDEMENADDEELESRSENALCLPVSIFRIFLFHSFLQIFSFMLLVSASFIIFFYSFRSAFTFMFLFF